MSRTTPSAGHAESGAPGREDPPAGSRSHRSDPSCGAVAGSAESALVLGLDAGGTKTLLVLADRAGAVVHHARAGGINPLTDPAWSAPLEDLLHAVPDDAWARVGFGVAGLPVHGELESISAAQTELMARLAPFPHLLRNDVHVACEAAFLGAPGALLLAGTGSMVWAADEAGRQLRVGGWGPWLGDEGSAFWIGREAAARLSWAIDGRLQDDGFAAPLATAIGLPSEGRQNALLRWFHGAEARPRIASLAATVDALAVRGNATARALMHEAASLLAAHVEAAWRLAPGLRRRPWSMAGGVARSRIVREQISARLGSAPAEPVLPPVGGAVWRAAVEAGWPVDASWVARLRAGLGAE
ncbi:MAG TPA: BadF/BadG/BcrA/BcrD ATPase family protein [Acetobacteraceae bacterium]|nr:BadF/BadG/BcrA/BcrD ATPase family protein [Acetobacteraceae bacterium]